MLIGVVADETAAQEWTSAGLLEGITIQRLDQPVLIPGASGYIDLLFENSANRLQEWQVAGQELILVNDPFKTYEVLPEHMIRINAWPGFAGRGLIEASGNSTIWKEKAGQVLAAFHKKAEWVADIPGFISARVVSMIINEAWYALEEGVSTKEETDIAMKLGTNYPYGPFEWGEKIGLHRIYQLLKKLSAENSRYSPAGSLEKAATVQ